MIVGVDIGGTKTLVAEFSDNGKILREKRFPTPKKYSDFITALRDTVDGMSLQHIHAVCVAVPGLLDRQRGMVKALGNLGWQNKPIRKDIKAVFDTDHLYIENDSKLAGYAEVRNIKDYKSKRIYYITISTGIGGTLLINGDLAREVIDGEIGMVPVENKDGEMTRWEDIASGRAFYSKYGKKADDVSDKSIWSEFSKLLGPGIAMVCCIYQVDVIIFGGGLGLNLKKFKRYLKPYVSTYLHTTIKKPRQLVVARHGDNSVIYGCYEYAHDKL